MPWEPSRSSSPIASGAVHCQWLNRKPVFKYVAFPVNAYSHATSTAPRAPPAAEGEEEEEEEEEGVVAVA